MKIKYKIESAAIIVFIVMGNDQITFEFDNNFFMNEKVKIDDRSKLGVMYKQKYKNKSHLTNYS